MDTHTRTHTHTLTNKAHGGAGIYTYTPMLSSLQQFCVSFKQNVQNVCWQQCSSFVAANVFVRSFACWFKYANFKLFSYFFLSFWFVLNWLQYFFVVSFGQFLFFLLTCFFSFCFAGLFIRSHNSDSNGKMEKFKF